MVTTGPVRGHDCDVCRSLRAPCEDDAAGHLRPHSAVGQLAGSTMADMTDIILVVQCCVHLDRHNIGCAGLSRLDVADGSSLTAL